MKCPRCGEEIPESSAFCPKCGFNLNLNGPIDNPAHQAVSYGGNFSQKASGKNVTTNLDAGSASSGPFDPNNQIRGEYVMSILCFIAGLVGFIMALVTKGKIAANPKGDYVMSVVLIFTLSFFAVLLFLIGVLTAHFRILKMKDSLKSNPWIPFFIGVAALIFGLIGGILSIPLWAYI